MGNSDRNVASLISTLAPKAISGTSVTIRVCITHNLHLFSIDHHIKQSKPMSENAGIKVIYEDSVVRLIFNRPKQLNALNDDIRKVVASTLNDLMERPDIRLLVLSGEGKSFCSGADLKTTSYPKVTSS